MAKIKSLTIFKKDRTTNKVLLHFSVDIRVNSSGVFLAKLPTEIEDKLKAINMLSDDYRRGGEFSANTLDEIEKLINTAIEPLTEFEQIENRIVIKYCIKTACVYAKTKDGEYLPNSMDSTKEYEETGKSHFYHNGTEERDGGSRFGPYGVEIYCGFRRRITNRYKDGTEKTYYDYVKREDLGINGQWIRDLIGISPSRYYNTLDQVNNAPEIEYTEKSALFFRQFITGIFKINEYTEQIRTSDNLMKLIEQQKQLTV